MVVVVGGRDVVYTLTLTLIELLIQAGGRKILLEKTRLIKLKKKTCIFSNSQTNAHVCKPPSPFYTRRTQNTEHPNGRQWAMGHGTEN